MLGKGKTFKVLILSMFLIVGTLSSAIVFADETQGASNERPIITEDNKVQDAEKTAEPNQASKNEVIGNAMTEKTEDLKASKEIKSATVETQAKATQNAPVARGNGNADKFYFEILPEILMKEGSKNNPSTLFSDPYETAGILRNIYLFGGGFSSTNALIEEAWGNVAFNVYDENGNLIDTTKGTIGDHNRWGGAKYLGPYDKGHNYTVSVDPSTLPKGYYSYMTQDYFTPAFPADIMTINGYKVAKYDKSFTKDFAALRFHMDLISVSYAKNEAVAKNQFTLNNDGEVTGWNPAYTKDKDYILKSFDRDGKLPIPNQEEMEKLADKGYKPNGFYYYFADKKGQRRTPILYEQLKEGFRLNYNGYEYLKKIKDNDGINTNKKFKFSGIFTMILDQSIPKVTFDVCGGTPEIAEPMEVGYKMSIATDGLDSSVMPKNPMKAGYVFAGWNTKQDGSGVAFTEDTVVTGDITVYAQWKEKKYTITVDPNGGNWNGDTAIKTQQFKENEKFKLPEAPKKDGYIFMYWKGSQYQPGQEYTVKEDHKFTAEWNKNPVLEVKDTTINLGDEIDLKTLIETAMDEEDGQNLIDKVLIDKGNFNSKRVGEYTVTFTLTDSNGASVTKEAIVTVVKKDKSTPKPDNSKPQVSTNNKALPKTGDSSNMVLYATLIGLSGALIAAVAFKRRKES